MSANFGVQGSWYCQSSFSAAVLSMMIPGTNPKGKTKSRSTWKEMWSKSCTINLLLGTADLGNTKLDVDECHDVRYRCPWVVIEKAKEIEGDIYNHESFSKKVYCTFCIFRILTCTSPTKAVGTRTTYLLFRLYWLRYRFRSGRSRRPTLLSSNHHHKPAR